MRSLSVLAQSILLATSVLPSVVSAKGALGFSIGVQANDGSCKNAQQFKSDLQKISSTSKVIRIYSASTCDSLKNFYPVVKELGFKMVLGIWPNDDNHFGKEVKALQEYIPKYGADHLLALTVGSEAMYRKDMTGSDLAKRINNIKETMSKLGKGDIPVGTADSWNMFLEGNAEPAIKASDIILANAFSFWQGQVMANASHSFFDDIMQALTRVQQVKGTTDLQFWVGETGWPMGGKNFENAKPGKENAAQYWKEAVCPMLQWGINVFAFEAFDEKWKPVEKDNDVEVHWGVFDDDGKPRYDLKC